MKNRLLSRMMLGAVMAFSLSACGGTGTDVLSKVTQVSVNAAQLSNAASDIDQTLKAAEVLYSENQHKLNEAQKAQLQLNHEKIQAFVDAIQVLRKRENAGRVAMSLLEIRGLLQTAQVSYASTRDIAKSLVTELDPATLQKMRQIDAQAIRLDNSINTALNTVTESIDPKITQTLSDALIMMRSVAEIAKSFKH